MNTKRLTILRDALIKHAKNPGNLKFDLGYWASIPRKYAEHPEREKAVAKAALGENFCGTAACAMGFATTIPAFKRAGLTLAVRAYDDGRGMSLDADVIFKGRYDLHGFFAISEHDFWELFGSDSYAQKDRTNPLAVAEKITALLHTA